MARFLVMLMAWVPMAAMAVGVGDPEAGEELAASCASCHGVDGNSTVSIWPKLAGQHQDYATRQSILIREQKRNVPEMYPMVADLSDQELADISAFYEQQRIEPGVADEDLVELGKKVYQAGNHDTGVPACAACHGPSGDGIPGAHFPMVRAQHTDYTVARLEAYRAGEHHGEDDPYSQIMVAAARNLTDEEIQAVSSYIEGLHRAR
ncbi:cytochrome c4 [Wenzhouxiangella sp. AB-CW3]|uniref:c-type cytochrome n=1 Tax=Wenzhouxiangella sp. AB-CW3 TaxID=2771012 RepID=UPI00168BA5A8|nr:c-type cytochrome [Wenzhouxiangella sp. AB-CW3]QOC22333.1 cytochrome c4 [Wenzhouxiangella sp. AB-CW3]